MDEFARFIVACALVVTVFITGLSIGSNVVRKGQCSMFGEKLEIETLYDDSICYLQTESRVVVPVYELIDLGE